MKGQPWSQLPSLPCVAWVPASQGSAGLRGCWKPQVLSRERRRGCPIYLPLILVPLSHSNHTLYPSATPTPTPAPGRTRPVSEIGLSPAQVFCVQQEAFCFFYSLFRLTLCLPVSRKVRFFCRGFVCMYEAGGKPQPPEWARAALFPALGVSTVPWPAQHS